MFDVNKAIYACDDVICRNIESFTTAQRGLLSQNILQVMQLRLSSVVVMCPSIRVIGNYWRH